MSDLYQSGANGLFVFLVLTVILGGAAAWSTGRAIAQTWKPYWQLATYMALLATAVRFFHYALFGEPLLAIGNYLASLVVLAVAGAAGHLVTRRRQMAQQYAFERPGP
ncbi:MAG: DUF6867 family protein [Hyphomicrobiaceae bacterium]